LSHQKVGTFQKIGQQKVGGNVACYFCKPDCSVIHAIPGPVDEATFSTESPSSPWTAQLGVVPLGGGELHEAERDPAEDRFHEGREARVRRQGRPGEYPGEGEGCWPWPECCRHRSNFSVSPTA